MIMTSETLLREVCPDTSTEPPLQPLSREVMELLTANRDQEGWTSSPSEFGVWDKRRFLYLTQSESIGQFIT